MQYQLPSQQNMYSFKWNSSVFPCTPEKLLSQMRPHASINKIPFSAVCVSKNKPVKQKILLLREIKRTASAAYLKPFPRLDAPFCLHTLVHMAAGNNPIAAPNLDTSAAQIEYIRLDGEHLPITAFSSQLGRYFSTEMAGRSWRSRGMTAIGLVFLFSCLRGIEQPNRHHILNKHTHPDTSVSFASMR